MAMWNPWRGCHKYSEGCRFCYIHKGDARRGVDTNVVTKADNFCTPVERYKRGEKKGEYKMKSGETVYLCFSSDFLLPDADQWRSDCWRMMRDRSDLRFLFLTKRIERFVDCVPDDWGDGYENVTVGCTVENQAEAQLGVPYYSLAEWRQKRKAFGDHAFVGSGVRRDAPLSENERRLMKEIAELRKANEILKDALFFCQRPETIKPERLYEYITLPRVQFLWLDDWTKEPSTYQRRFNGSLLWLY